MWSCEMLPSVGDKRAKSLAVLAGGSREPEVCRRAAQEEMRIVVPGNADTAEDLDAVLDNPQGRVRDHGLRRAGQATGLRVFVGDGFSEARCCGQRDFEPELVIGQPMLEGLVGPDLAA